jgi:tetratricopeptide (TPR) repeat protein
VPAITRSFCRSGFVAELVESIGIRQGHPFGSETPELDARAERLMIEALGLHRRGKLSAAAERYQQIIGEQPENAYAWHLLGNIALEQGKPAEAAAPLRRAAELQSHVAAFHLNLGFALQSGGELQQAMLSLERALRLEPGQVDGWVGLSEILMELGELTPSLDCLRQALLLEPNHVRARLLLAQAQMQTNESQAAIANYQFVLRREPGNLVAAVNLASLLRASGETASALQLLKGAQARDASSSTIRYNLANLLVDTGDFNGAREHYISLLEDHPQPAKVFYNLSTIWKFRAEDRPRLQVWQRSIQERSNGSNEELTHLHFGLGKAHDDLGEFDDAFEHYRLANSLVPVQFDPLAHRQFLARLMSVWTAPLLQNRQQWGCGVQAPIFIVGMPRSGTTLVDQILCRHSQVQGLGEREEFSRLVGRLCQHLDCPGDPITAVSRITQTDTLNAAVESLQRVKLNPGVERFTDKTPLNFLLLGWIATLFPQAKIIHCVRDPRDVCLSCYFQHFTSRLPFAYDLAHLAAYCQDYQRLMAHWQAALPMPIFNVSYEDLVEQPERVSRRMYEFCEISWDASSLDPASSGNTVKTASHWQARQPIYQTSRGRWRNYRQHIAPLLRAFGDE